MLPPTEALRLLTNPAQALSVLAHLTEHPGDGAVASCRKLHVSLRSWYKALDQLEALDLVRIERYAGGHKVIRIEVAPRGRAVLQLLRGLPDLVSTSPAALERELHLSRRGSDPARTGELLCLLIEHAHRRGDFADLEALRRKALALGRPGEAAFAEGVVHFLRADVNRASVSLEASMAALEAEMGSRTFRRALYLHAFAADALGRGPLAYGEFSRLRRISREAQDLTSEGDARLGIGIQKARRGQFEDAGKHLERALECALGAGSLHRQATVLTTLCMVDFFVDHEKGLARSEEALAAARRSSAKVLQMHVHSNRALMFAVMGKKPEALHELTMTRRLSNVVGHERGEAMLKEWAALVRRILRQRPPGSLRDWRDRAIRILERPPAPAGAADE
jgi:tetratricopeptide (TPR) repeat protein